MDSPEGTPPKLLSRKEGHLRDGSPAPTAHRSFSAPLPVSAASPQTQPAPFSFTFDITPTPVEGTPSLQPTTTLEALEQDVITKKPPGQWFRKVPGKPTDITCLPVEMHIEILSKVSFLDQLSCERVCTTWRTIIRRDCATFRYTSIDDSPFTGITDKDSAEGTRRTYYTFTSSFFASHHPPPSKHNYTGKILIHRFLQDGNFAFRQIPGLPFVEAMSTYFPDHPHQPPRRFKIANLTFLSDPVAIYTTTAFKGINDIPSLTIEFDSEPLRNEFRLRIGGRRQTANIVAAIAPHLPIPWPGMLHPQPTPFIAPSGRYGQQSVTFNFGTRFARRAMATGTEYSRPWDLGAFLLAIQGKLESPRHWYEDSALEQNERWNGRGYERKFATGVDFHGDWDMDHGFRKPLTLAEIAVKEKELLEQYKSQGFWYMREWRKDRTIDMMHVALTPVSDWVWEICY
ncbi:hypothetical protein TWF696_000431 [Orbilia brochopaga]|uniref:F-box domain-containing protein n=1 Tax=Orbilia brochopaga TaxID=3140254 RepID=A0AAV9VDY2_9PEZI